VSLFLPSYPEWHRDALCAEIGGNSWFPEKGDTAQDARKICVRCPVRQECLDYALENADLTGIWGATSEWERKRMRRGEEVTPYIRAGRKMESRVCHFCGQEFQTYRKSAKFCSNVCSTKGWHQSQRELRSKAAGEESAA
jgi:hypothetical protein